MCARRSEVAERGIDAADALSAVLLECASSSSACKRVRTRFIISLRVVINRARSSDQASSIITK